MPAPQGYAIIPTPGMLGQTAEVIMTEELTKPVQPVRGLLLPLPEEATPLITGADLPTVAPLEHKVPPGRGAIIPLPGQGLQDLPPETTMRFDRLPPPEAVIRLAGQAEDVETN